MHSTVHPRPVVAGLGDHGRRAGLGGHRRGGGARAGRRSRLGVPYLPCVPQLGWAS